jgi:hypothetical protein
MSYKYLFYLIISLLIVSCGLQYIPSETPESQTLNRQTAIQNYLTETLQNDSSTYRSLAFGKTSTLKPISYLQLDSLHALKYNLEKRGKRDRDLEEAILIQRQIALNDTNGIIFLESHLFSLTTKNLATVYSAELKTDQSNKIKEVEIFETTNIAVQNLELFQIYTFEESFLQAGFKPLPGELNFYKKYKAQASNLSSEAKDKFVQNTLNIMRAAQKVQTLKTVALLSEVVRDRISGNNRQGAKNETFEAMEETYEMVDGNEVFTGYLIKYSFQRIENGLTTSYRYSLKASPYLEILSSGLY